MTVPAPAPPVTDNVPRIAAVNQHLQMSRAKERRGDTVKVRLTAPGSWIFPHVAVPIRVDGQQVAEGSVKKGFDVVVELSVGTHRVEVAKSAHQLDLWEEGCCEVAFEYSRAWANYARPPRVRFIGPEEAALSWPAQVQLEPPTVEVFDASLSAQDSAVLAELERLQNQQPSWWGALVTLAVSLLLYAAAARTQQLWDGIYLLIPVLAFHELGHYLTMRVFGYRNMRMFFIPFLGAAVSGQHYNVAGWKKAVVALAGPLPGIVVGVPLGVVGMVMGEPLVVELALLLFILNGFNLLPFLPLDGGWVVHAILFVRHPVLELVFRLVATLCLLGLAIKLGAWCLGFVVLTMLLATPLAFRLSRIAYRLGQEGLVARSPDAYSIPTESALQILAEVRRALPAQAAPKTLAQYVATVFETCNAEPPGAIASFGLLAAHAGGFLVALVMAIALTVFKNLPA